MSDALSANRSVLNPNDLGAMKREGRFQAGMTIRDFLGKFGLSPEDPVEKLVEMQQMQMQNATPIGKMESMAGPGMGTPPMEQPAPAGPPLDRLANMR